MAQDESRSIQAGSPTEGLRGLVSALSDNPELSQTSPAELSKQFDLPVTTVREVLAALGKDAFFAKTFQDRFVQVLSAIGGAFRFVADLWLRLTRRPYLFVGLDLALPWLLVVAVQALQISSAIGLATTLLGLAFLFALGCMLRWGKPLLAAFASAILFGILTTITLVQVVSGSRTAASVPTQLIGHLTLSLCFLVLAMLFAFAGHVAREVKLNRIESKMTRQELLDRSFWLRNRLEAIETLDPARVKIGRFLNALRTHAQYPLIVIVFALALGTMQVAFDLNAVDATQFGLQVDFVFGVVRLLFIATAGYLAPRSRTAMISMALAYFAIVLPTGIDRPPKFGIHTLLGILGSPGFFIGLAFVLAVGLIMGFVLQANRTEMRRRKVEASDPATVAAEIIRTHWRLYGKQSTCVLVVDVASSTRMKEAADPGSVEYSFRAYQLLVAKLAAARGGKVISTAGDGAVCTFTDAKLAIECARDIQSAIPEFNTRTNRLSSPFRLRVGLHAGTSAVDLSAAPFNQLIDVAAHVEQVAPVGGVAVTDDVVVLSQDEEFVELAASVDNHRVSVLTNPTRGA